MQGVLSPFAAFCNAFHPLCPHADPDADQKSDGGRNGPIEVAHLGTKIVDYITGGEDDGPEHDYGNGVVLPPIAFFNGFADEGYVLFKFCVGCIWFLL